MTKTPKKPFRTKSGGRNSSALRRYEAAKQEWDRVNPDASYIDRDAALLEIARKLGI